MLSNNKFLLFSGSSNKKLANEVAANLHMKLGQSVLDVFSDGEIRFQSHENVRGADVFIIQSLATGQQFQHHGTAADGRRVQAGFGPPHHGGDHLLRLRPPGPQGQAARRHFGALAGRSAGNGRVFPVLTIDLHATQIQGFFNIPVDNLMALPVFISHFKKMKLQDLVIVSPDAGGVERAGFSRSKLNADLAIADKRAPRPTWPS